MRARNVSMGEMFAWIPATFRLATRNFGAMALATIIMLVATVLLFLPMVFVMFKSMGPLGSPGVPQPQDMTGFWISYGLCILGGVLLLPPMLAGWFRLCAAADRGEPVSGMQVLAAYSDRNAWLRLVVFSLLGMLIYAVMWGLLFLLFGGLFTDMMAMQAAQQAAMATGGQPPAPDPALIGRIFLMYLLMMPTLAVLQVIYMVGMAEISLRPTSAVSALAEAVGGSLRNVLKLLLFGFCLLTGVFIVAFIVVLVAGLISFVLGMLSPVLGLVVFGLFYILILLAAYPLVFSGHYYVWKDMLGGDEPPALPA